ncbi:MAG: aminotransferase class V-fold PLP-dependent enzyme [Trueperaceae bacterium]
MSIYRRYGVKPLINAAGTKTRLGGALMSPEVLQAMTDAAAEAVDMAELQAAASKVIAGITGAQAGCVTSGAAAGLTLGAAACMTGLDPAKIDRLPNNHDLPHEIIIFRSHRNSYDHAWRAAGAKLIEVGLDDRAAGSGVRTLETWEIEAAINERTVAVAYVANRRNEPNLARLSEYCHSRNLPVLVDAAGQLPPAENLQAFIDSGADLVAFSGGKAIGGPQATGILCGKKELIQAALLNSLDMDMDLELWDPPPSLLPPESIEALPRHGIGRGFKVSKENIIGLLVALERFASGEWQRELEARREIAGSIARSVDETTAISAEYSETSGHPTVSLTFSTTTEARRVYQELLRGEPGIALDPADIYDGVLIVNTATLLPEHARVIAARLEAVT